MCLKRIGAVALALSVSGCASGYQQFYEPAAVSTDLERFSGEPRIVVGSGDWDRDVLAMYEEGLGLIGHSSFVGPAESQDGALKQAKEVGAAVVVIASKYRNTQIGQLPITTPTTTTSYSSGNVNAFSGGRSAVGSYSGTTTIYGTQTTYMPYSVDKYEQGAAYFAPLVRKGLGVWLGKPTDDHRKAMESNRGMLITAVRRGSPAFKADLLPGDVLLSIGGETVSDRPEAQRAIAAVSGQTVDVRLFRNGQQVLKRVTFPAGHW
jgi:hypothetical protein